MKFLQTLCLLLCTSIALSVQAQSTIATSPSAAQTVQTVIDVRTPQEYATGHVPGAINIPYDQIVARANEITSAKNDLVIVYCRSGRRSAMAKQTLEHLGFMQVVDKGAFANYR